jgi:hypothetical protein
MPVDSLTLCFVSRRLVRIGGRKRLRAANEDARLARLAAFYCIGLVYRFMAQIALRFGHRMTTYPVSSPSRTGPYRLRERYVKRRTDAGVHGTTGTFQVKSHLKFTLLCERHRAF